MKPEQVVVGREYETNSGCKVTVKAVADGGVLYVREYDNLWQGGDIKWFCYNYHPRRVAALERGHRIINGLEVCEGKDCPICNR